MTRFGLLTLTLCQVTLLVLLFASAAAHVEAVKSKVNGKSQQQTSLRASETASEHFQCTSGSCPNSQQIVVSCSTCSIDAIGVLSCVCENEQGGQVFSTLTNSWSCGGCIGVDNNGELYCNMPKPASNNPYTNDCSECGIMKGSDMRCAKCEFSNGGVGALTLTGACDCASVGYLKNQNRFVCNAPTTPSPTNPPQATPTPSPVSKTNAPSAPTPAGPPSAETCTGTWADFNKEAAPWKYCQKNNDGIEYFTSKYGCQGQNYCCWVSTGSDQDGECFMPLNAQVECPSLNGNQKDCDNESLCFYNSKTGVCSRKCPGNQQSLCNF